MRVAKKRKNVTKYGFESAKKRKVNENEPPYQAKLIKSEPKSVEDDIGIKNVQLIVDHSDVNNGLVMNNIPPIHVQETPPVQSEDYTKLNSNAVLLLYLFIPIFVLFLYFRYQCRAQSTQMKSKYI